MGSCRELTGGASQCGGSDENHLGAFRPNGYPVGLDGVAAVIRLPVVGRVRGVVFYGKKSGTAEV